MGRQKSLHLPRLLESLHNPLPSSRRLVGVLRSAIEALVLAVLGTGHDLTLGGRMAVQLVSDQHTRHSLLLRQQLAKQAFGSFLVAPALHEDIKNEALLVDCTPEPVFPAGDSDDHFVQVPLVATTWTTPTDTIGKFAAECQASLPDRIVGHRDPTGRQHLLGFCRKLFGRTCDTHGYDGLLSRQ
jgi:hypothetical protein